MGFTIGIITLVFSFIIIIVAITNYFSYKEKELMLNKGVAPEVVEKIATKGDSDEPTTKLGNLRSGLTLIAVGGALTIGLLFMGVGPWILGGLIPLFLGIARLLLYYLLPDDE